MGEAVCAAYQEDSAVNMLYFVCRIPHGMTAEEAACLYNRRNLTCYECGDSGEGLNSTSSLVSDLGIETSSCLLNIWLEGLFVCLAQRQWRNGSTSMFQQIGSFNASKSHQAVYMCNSDTSLRSYLIAVSMVLAIVLVILACSCVGCYCWHKCKRDKVKKSQCKL